MKSKFKSEKNKKTNIKIVVLKKNDEKDIKIDMMYDK